MSITNFTGSTATDLLTFLNANKAGTFLENCTIETVEHGLMISKNGKSLTITYNNSTSAVSWRCGFAYNNGNTTLTIYNNYNNCYVPSAILCGNGIIFDFYEQSTGKITGAFTLTIDSNGELACLFHTTSNGTFTTDTTLKKVAVGDSVSPTQISTTTVYGLNKTALTPIVINTPTGNTTIPVLYISIQNQLPGLGLQAGRMDSTDYITNGYCFIRD